MDDKIELTEQRGIKLSSNKASTPNLQLKNLNSRQKHEIDVNSFSESKRMHKRLKSGRKNATERDNDALQEGSFSRRNHFSKLTITTERSHSVHNARDPYSGVSKEMLINELEILKQR